MEATSGKLNNIQNQCNISKTQAEQGQRAKYRNAQNPNEIAPPGFSQSEDVYTENGINGVKVKLTISHKIHTALMRSVFLLEHHISTHLFQ